MAYYQSESIFKPKSEGGSSIFEYYVTVDILSQSIANNTTTFRVDLCMLTTTGSNQQWSTSAPYAPSSSLSIDGVAFDSDVNSESSKYSISDGKIKTYWRSQVPLVIASKTMTVAHNSDGEKTLSVAYNWIRGSGSTTAYYPKSFATPSAYTVVLPTISRVGMVESDSAVLISSENGSFPYAVRVYVNGWYYRLKYTVEGGESGYVWGYNSSGVATNPVSKSVGVTNLTLGFGDLLDKITSATVKNVIFTLETYSDSSGSVLVGSSTRTVMVSIDSTVFRPTLSLGSIIPNTTPIQNKLIAGKSSAKMPFTATKPRGASSVTSIFNASVGGLVASSIQGLSGVVVSQDLPASASDYNYSIRGRAVDGRNVSSLGEVVSGVVSVYGYTAPSIEGSAIRVQSNGSTVEDGAGEWVYVRFKITALSSVGGSNSIVANTVSCKFSSQNYNEQPLALSLVDGEYRAWIDLSADDVGIVAVSGADTVLNASSDVVSVTYRVPMAMYPLDLYDDGTAQNMGVGLAGAMAEANKVKSAKPIYADFIGDLTGTATNSESALVSDKLGSSSKGGVNQPIYLNGGLPQVGNEYVPKGGGSFTGNVDSSGSIIGARDILWEGTMQGGNNIDLDVSGYSQIRVWFHMYALTFPVDVDLMKVPNNDVSTTYPDWYAGSGMGAYYTNRAETYYGVVLVNPAKSIVRIHYVAFYYGTSYNARNNNSNYYAYRVEGLRK